MYSIDDLCDALRLSRRQVQKYVRRGLLPRPHGYGRWARYGEEHMKRARAIRAAREANVTLADLADRFNPPGLSA